MTIFSDSRFPVNGRVELFFSPGPDKLHGKYSLAVIILATILFVIFLPFVFCT